MIISEKSKLHYFNRNYWCMLKCYIKIVSAFLIESNLNPFVSSPGQSPIELLVSLGVNQSYAVNFFTFYSFFRSTKWNQTCQGWSFGTEDLDLYK